MAAANAHHRCGAVNLRSKQSRFYLYLCIKLRSFFLFVCLFLFLFLSMVLFYISDIENIEYRTG